MNPQELIATVAEREIGVREESRNYSPRIERYWQGSNYPDGAQNREPWCSAFASWCVREADRLSDEIRLLIPPRMPAVRQWRAWAEDELVGALVFTCFDQSHRPQRGDVVVFLPHMSHVGIVAGFREGAGFKTVHTVEGNTNAQGAREGDGVWARERRLADCGYFIRIPAITRRTTNNLIKPTAS